MYIAYKLALACAALEMAGGLPIPLVFNGLKGSASA
jgi:hypothetical protein